MAARYPIITGGASNTTATWATSSGQAVGGASIPVSGDSVICDATMVGNLVWTGSQSFDTLDCTGCTGTMSGSGSLTILGGTFTLDAGMTYTATGTVTFTGANAVGSVAIDCAGKTVQTVVINGSSKTFNLAGDINTVNTFTVTAGTFNRNGYAMVLGNSFLSNNTNVRTIDLSGAGTFITGNVINIDGTNLTFSAPDVAKTVFSSSRNTSNPILTAGVAFKTFQLSRAPGGASTGGTLNASGGTLSMERFELVDAENANFLGCFISITADITIDSADFSGVQLVSSANGTQRTITTNTNEISFDGCMIRDIVISGGPAYATNSIDLGNNSGITFNNFGPNTSSIVGVTNDDAGSPLGSCLVVALKEDGGVLKEVSRTTSDAVTGAYTLPTPDTDANAYTVVGTKTSAYRGDAMNGITPT